MWFGKNAKQLEWEHVERMKCLERGLPLPDAELAWTKVVWCASAFVLLCLARHAMAGLLHLKRPTPTALPRPSASSSDELRLAPYEQVVQGASSEGIQTSWFGRPAVVDDD